MSPTACIALAALLHALRTQPHAAFLILPGVDLATAITGGTL